MAYCTTAGLQFLLYTIYHIPYASIPLCPSCLYGGMKVLVLSEGIRFIAGNVTRSLKLCRGFAPGIRMLAEDITCILCFSTRRGNGEASDGFSSS